MSKIVTARKPHVCTENSCHDIAAGERYLRCVMTPWNEFNDTRRYFTGRVCLRCAARQGMLLSPETQAELTPAELAALPAWAVCRVAADESGGAA